jgi:hypothetical protein
MWPLVMDTASAVQMVMLISCTMMGLSHLLQPGLWSDFFGELRERGSVGLVISSFINSTPAAVIVGLHQVWSGAAIVLSVFGWLLLAKSVTGLILPKLGLRLLRLSRHGDRAFRGAGIGLLVIAAACGLALAGY